MQPSFQLFYAIEDNDMEKIRELVKIKHNLVGVVDVNNDTPLTAAVETGDLIMVKTIVKAYFNHDKERVIQFI